MTPTIPPSPNAVRRAWVLPVGAALCLLPAVPGWLALLAGAIGGLGGLNVRPQRTARAAHMLLQVSVVALGAALPLRQVVHAGLDGLGVTACSIAVTLLLGHVLGRLFRVPTDTTLLVSGGTAICGGSAIAALAGALRPRSHEVTIALATVFALNAVALVMFPPLGHAFGLTQRQFGWWAALAIHDTSSVVGAGLAYGSAALAVATTVKLARALWIAPLTAVVAFRRRRASRATPEGPAVAYLPWFIVAFLAVAVVVAAVPPLAPFAAWIGRFAPRLLVATLFCIGAGFTRAAFRSVGLRPLLLAVTLWILVGGASLLAIKSGWVGQ